MAVNAVRNDGNHKKTSYLKSIVIGGITGYALKYAIPITPQEMDDDFNARLGQIKESAKSFKPPEADEFINSGKRALIAEIKDIRPTGIFLLTGICAGALMALINNIMNYGK
ncbi:MAG: hypothetical protein PHC64_10060 [Candidatus Gastranaerophilales bacterium]|nr:hypothetical protein [Candidatus Gastranaerophilales bacterium]